MNKYFEKVILKSTNSKEIVEIHVKYRTFGVAYGKIYSMHTQSNSLLKVIISDAKNVRLPEKEVIRIQIYLAGGG